MSRRIISSLSTLLLAFVLAVLVWIVATLQSDPIETRRRTGINLAVTPQAADLVILNQDDIPGDIAVDIRAPSSEWSTLTLAQMNAWVDLSGLPAGAFNIPVQVDLRTDRAVVERSVPTEITLQLEPLAAATFPVMAKVLDEAPLGYFYRPPTTNPMTATVRGSQAAVAQVAQLLAEVTLDDSKQTVQSVVPLIPRDQDGNIVSQVSVEPVTAAVEVEVEQRFGYKDVSVKAVVTGQPASGYSIGSISVSPGSVTLVGSPSILEDAPGFVETMPVDVTDATDGVSQRVALNLPAGTSIVVDDEEDPQGTYSVLVNVGISPLSGGSQILAPVSIQGLEENLVATTEPNEVEVVLVGPLPVLQNMDSEAVTVLVDVFGLEEGVHRLQPSILVPEGVSVTGIIPDTVEITLAPRISITVSPTPVSTPTRQSPTRTPTRVTTEGDTLLSPQQTVTATQTSLVTATTAPSVPQ